MPVFQYLAVDPSGKKYREKLEAASEGQAIETLKERQLTVIEMKQTEKADAKSSSSALAFAPFFSGIPAAIVLNFYEQLGFLIKSGIPMFQAIRMLSESFRNPRLLKILRGVLFDISEGSPLSTALQKFPSSFPLLHTNLIAVGEKSGNLDSSLHHLVELVREQQDIKQRIVAASSYPVFLLGLSVSLVIGLLYFVFPKFQEIFKAFNVKLPPITAFLIETSEQLRSHILTILFSLALMIIGLAYFFRSERTSEQRDRFLLAVPVVGDLYVSMFVALFAKTLGSLLKAGIPILEGLIICQQTIRGALKFQFFEKLITTVKDGEPTSKGMENSPFMPELGRQLVVVGEKTGDLDNMMESVFAFYKKRYGERLKMLTGMLAPLFMFFAAGLIAVVAISLFVPLFKLSSSIRQGE